MCLGSFAPYAQAELRASRPCMLSTVGSGVHALKMGCVADLNDGWLLNCCCAAIFVSQARIACCSGCLWPGPSGLCFCTPPRVPPPQTYTHNVRYPPTCPCILADLHSGPVTGQCMGNRAGDGEGVRGEVSSKRPGSGPGSMWRQPQLAFHDGLLLCKAAVAA